MLKTTLLIVSITLNIYLLYIVIDHSVSIAYMGVSIKDKEKSLTGCKYILDYFKDKIELAQLVSVAKSNKLSILEKTTNIESINELIINNIIFQYSKETQIISSVDISNLDNSKRY